MIYFLQGINGGEIKVGTSVNVTKRHKRLESYYGQPLRLLGVIEGDRQTERKIHAKFAHLRIRKTEQFEPGADLLGFIRQPVLGGVMLEHAVARSVQPVATAVRLELPVETHRELRIEAAKQGVSMATFVRNLVESCLARLAGPKPPTKKGGKT